MINFVYSSFKIDFLPPFLFSNFNQPSLFLYLFITLTTVDNFDPTYFEIDEYVW